VDQEESILLLFPDALMNTKRNIISKRNKWPYSRLGEKTKERALAVTGIKTVHWQDFERYYSKWLMQRLFTSIRMNITERRNWNTRSAL
jgi:uncharacterized protein (DUF1697 family)